MSVKWMWWRGGGGLGVVEVLFNRKEIVSSLGGVMGYQRRIHGGEDLICSQGMCNLTTRRYNW